MIAKLFTGVFSLKKTLTMALVFIAIGFTSGAWTINKYYDSKEVDKLRKLIGLQEVNHKKEIRIIYKYRAKKIALEKRKVKTEGLENEIKDNPICNIPVNVERLLDLSRTGKSDNTALSGQSPDRPTLITQRQQVRSHQKDGEAYQELKIDFMNLQDLYKNNCYQIKS